MRDRCARTKTSGLAQGQPSPIPPLFFENAHTEKKDVLSNEIQPKAQIYMPVGSAPSQSLRVTTVHEPSHEQ